MRRFVFAYDVNTELIQARRSFDDWATILRDDDEQLEIESWDDIYAIVCDRYMYGGDFSEFVSEADVDYPDEDLDDTPPTTHRASYLDLSNGPD